MKARDLKDALKNIPEDEDVIIKTYDRKLKTVISDTFLSVTKDAQGYVIEVN